MTSFSLELFSQALVFEIHVAKVYRCHGVPLRINTLSRLLVGIIFLCRNLTNFYVACTVASSLPVVLQCLMYEFVLNTGLACVIQQRLNAVEQFRNLARRKLI